jgi:uncharacterized protein (TIGR00251 family)
MIRAVPKSARNRVVGAVADADGKLALKVALAAAPEAGKANAALVELLAATLAVPCRNIAIVSGETSRRKIVEIKGDGASLMSRIQDLLAPPP